MLSSLKDYTSEDLANYKNSLKQTNVKHGISRPTPTYKWRYILAPGVGIV